MVDSDDADSDDPEYEPRPEWAKGELVSDQYTVLTGKLNIANISCLNELTNLDPVNDVLSAFTSFNKIIV